MKRIKRILSVMTAVFVTAASLPFGMLSFTADAVTAAAGTKLEDIMTAETYTDETIREEAMNYRIWVPEAAVAAGEKVSLFIYLNGAGSRGTDNIAQLKNMAPMVNPIINGDNPCVVLIPQLGSDERWVDKDWDTGAFYGEVEETEVMKLLISLIGDTVAAYNVDTDRIYIAGQSMGGYGTWDAITRYPDLFAAAMPMCGGMNIDMLANVVDMPITTLHGSSDPTVPVSGTRTGVETLKKLGSTSVTYYEFDGDDHYIQRRVFEQPDMWYDWIFSQVKGKTEKKRTNESELYWATKDATFNFNTSSQKDRWTCTGSGVFELSGSEYKLNSLSQQFNLAVVTDSDGFFNGQVSAFFTYSSLNDGGSGLVLRVSEDMKTYLHIRFTASGVQIIEMVNGAAAKTATVAMAVPIGRIMNLVAVLNGASLKVRVDGVDIADYTVSNSVLKSSSGRVGLRTYGTAACTVDDFIYVKDETSDSVAAGWTVNDYSDRQVIQRNTASESATVTVSGTASAGAAGVKVAVADYNRPSVLIADWTDADYDSTTGNFSAAIPDVAQGGWYRTLVITVDSDGSAINRYVGENRYGIGMIILCMGQSNMVGYGLGEFVDAADTVSLYKSQTSWNHLADPYASAYTDGRGGSMTPSIGNSLSYYYDVPVAFIPAASSGTAMLQHPTSCSCGGKYWTDFESASGLYQQSVSKVKAAGGVEFIIMNQGEHDVSKGPQATTAGTTEEKALALEQEYYDAVLSVVEHYRSDLGYDVPFIYCELGPALASAWSSDQTLYNAYMTAVRNAQQRLDDPDNGIYLGATEFDLTRNDDDLHYDAASQAVIGKRMANTMKYVLGDLSGYKGPEIVSAAVSSQAGNTVDVRLRHDSGSDISPETGITGFEVFDGGASAEIESVYRLNPTTIRIKLKNPLGSDDVALRYLYGLKPDVSGLVKDNSPLALPMLATDGTLAVSAFSPADIYYNDFENADAIGDFRVVTATADSSLTVSGGKLNAAAVNTNTAMLLAYLNGITLPEDFVICADVSLPSDMSSAGAGGFTFRQISDSAYYHIRFLYKDGVYQAQLYRFGSSTVLLASGAVDLAAGQTYQMQVVCKDGGNYAFYVDGESLDLSDVNASYIEKTTDENGIVWYQDITDSAYSGGSAGVRSYNNIIFSYDNLMIMSGSTPAASLAQTEKAVKDAFEEIFIGNTFTQEELYRRLSAVITNPNIGLAVTSFSLTKASYLADGSFSADITLTYNGETAAFTLVKAVSMVDVKSLKLSAYALSLRSNETVSVGITGLILSDGTEMTDGYILSGIGCTTSDVSIAFAKADTESAVSVLGKNKGTAVVTVSASVGSKTVSASIEVTVGSDGENTQKIEFDTSNLVQATVEPTKVQDSNPMVSESYVMAFKPTALLAEITFDIGSFAAGTYRVELYAKYYTQYGIYQMYIDDTPIGEPVDFSCASADIRYELSDMGIAQLEDGAHTVTFALVGNGALGNKMTYGAFDYVRLVEQVDYVPCAEHVFGEWVTVTEPTEDSEGLREHRCTVCGDSEAEAIPATGVKPGDVNSDGTVDDSDLQLLRQCLVGDKAEINLQAADYNGDGTVNAKDVTLLRRYLAGRA